MEVQHHGSMPTQCPACASNLLITRLQCPACGTEVAGAFRLAHLASLQEPYASLIELFLQTRGNVKEMERELGLSYPTVRARLEEALTAAGLGRSDEGRRAEDARRQEAELAELRSDILDAVERGQMSAAEAAARLRELKSRRSL